MELRPRPSTEWELDMSFSEVAKLYAFLDWAIPHNSRLPVAEPGAQRQRFSDDELKWLSLLRMELFKVVHG